MQVLNNNDKGRQIRKFLQALMINNQNDYVKTKLEGSIENLRTASDDEKRVVQKSQQKPGDCEHT